MYRERIPGYIKIFGGIAILIGISMISGCGTTPNYQGFCTEGDGLSNNCLSAEASNSPTPPPQSATTQTIPTVATTPTQPPISPECAAYPSGFVVLVKLSTATLWICDKGILQLTDTGIAVGSAQYPTPIGDFSLTHYGSGERLFIGEKRIFTNVFEYFGQSTKLHNGKSFGLYIHDIEVVRGENTHGCIGVNTITQKYFKKRQAFTGAFVHIEN
jgi:hypothetical protein